MPPITHSESPFLQILNLLNMDKVINLTDINPTMRFLLDRHDKIAIDDSMIFYLDPYNIRTYADSVEYCNDLNMSVALPRSRSQNDLIAKLMLKWNTKIDTRKFDSIEPWIAVGLTEPKAIGEFKNISKRRNNLIQRISVHRVL